MKYSDLLSTIWPLIYIPWISFAYTGSPGIQIKTINQFDDVTVLNQYTASVGSNVDLPCDLTIPSAEDSISLILWYKNDRKSPPIYSVDARNSPVNKASHFAADVIKNRAKFDITTRPGVLRLNSLKETDTGLYLCRVDFKWARTVNTLNNLTIVELAPPLESCSISNQTSESFYIQCYHHRSGYLSNNNININSNKSLLNGSTKGELQSPDSHHASLSPATSSSSLPHNKLNYHLEVYSSTKDKVIHNLTTMSPQFTINGLQPDTAYLIYAYSSNTFATSSPTILRTKTLPIKKPEPAAPLESCSIQNKTQNSFSVACYLNVERALRDSSNFTEFHQESDTPGSKSDTLYHLEVFTAKDTSSPSLITNRTNLFPIFSISGLQPSTSYTLYAYTSNNVGTSPPLVVNVDLPSIAIPQKPKPAPSLESCVISNQTVESFLIECSVKRSSLNMDTSDSSITRTVSYSPLDAHSSSFPLSSLSSSSSSSTSEISSNPDELDKQRLTYHLEVYHSDKDELLLNLTSSVARFLVKGLKSDTSYLVYAYSSNFHGKSDSITLHAKTPSLIQETQGLSVPLKSCSITNQTWGSFLVECLPESSSLVDEITNNSSNYDNKIGQSELSESGALLSSSTSSSTFSQPSKAIYHLEVFSPERDKLLYNMTNSSPIFSISGLEPNTSYLLNIYTSSRKGRSSSLVLKSGTLTMMTRKQDYNQNAVEIFDSRILILVLGSSCLLLLLALMILIIMKIRKRDEAVSTRKRRDSIKVAGEMKDLPTSGHLGGGNNNKMMIIDSKKDEQGNINLTSSFAAYNGPGAGGNIGTGGLVGNNNKKYPSDTLGGVDQQPKWILVNTSTNPDVIPTKAGLPQGNSGNCSNLTNSRLLDGCPISPPLTGTLSRQGMASIKVDPNVINGAYNVPHVTLITNSNSRPQSQLIITPQNVRPPELSIFPDETFEESNIVSFSTAV